MNRDFTEDEQKLFDDAKAGLFTNTEVESFTVEDFRQAFNEACRQFPYANPLIQISGVPLHGIAVVDLPDWMKSGDDCELILLSTTDGKAILYATEKGREFLRTEFPNRKD